MPYATLEDLNTRFGQEEIMELSDRDDDGASDDNVVDDALAAASSEIDSYLGVRYEIPIGSVSDNLNRTCCDIARFLLHENAAIDEVEKRYKRAIDWLKDLATGKAVLTDANGQPISIGAPSTGGSVKYKTNDRQFSDDTLAGF